MAGWLAGRAVRSVGQSATSCAAAALAKYLLDLLFDFYVRINAAI